MNEQQLAETAALCAGMPRVEALIAEVRRLRTEGCPSCTLIGELEAEVKRLWAWIADAIDYYHLQPDCDGFDAWRAEEH